MEEYEALKRRYIAVNFDFDDDVIENYTEGACAELALALQKKLEGEVLEVWSIENIILHWFLKIPDGRCIDINGIYLSERDLLDFWTANMRITYDETDCYEIRPLSNLIRCKREEIQDLDDIVSIIISIV